MDIRKEKSAARDLFRSARKAVPAEERKRLDVLINTGIINSASFRYAEVLLAYFPVGFEVNILPTVEEAFRRGKPVAFPLCEAEGIMSFGYCSSIAELIPDKYGIPAPPQCGPKYEGEKNALCLVPGMAYDKAGYRIGYGRGYYDRFISSFDGISVGVIYSDFCVDSLPIGKYDRKVSFIISERGLSAVT